MRKIFLAISLWLLVITANAQYVSLNKTEIKKLIALCKSDPVVMKNCKALEVVADIALLQQPGPVDTIISEGHLATDPKKIITQKALGDMNRIYALAFSYKITGKQEYVKKCVEFLVAWARVNRSAGNPINDTKLDPLLEGYDLVKDEIAQLDRSTIDNWLMQVADAEISNPRFHSANRSSMYNNWNSHRIKVVGLIAYILNNKAYQEFTDTSIKKQILENLYANGSGFDFEERDALHYHIYTLEPLLKIARTIKRATGVDYFVYTSSTGSSIKKSITFLVPFATGEQVHHEFVNSKVAFDKKRADNKEPGYTIGANFKPESAIGVLSSAAFFDPQYTTVVKKLSYTTEMYPNWETVLNAVAQ